MANELTPQRWTLHPKHRLKAPNELWGRVWMIINFSNFDQNVSHLQIRDIALQQTKHHS